jgi:hypothetical protein
LKYLYFIDIPQVQPAETESVTFTDDTVMMVVVANAILEGVDYGSSLKAFGRKYPNAGYGGTFINWIFQPEVQPYNSWGKGQYSYPPPQPP